MKRIILISLLLIACTFLSVAKQPEEIAGLKKQFDKYNVEGAILIYDKNNNAYKGYNLERCNMGCIPASTFKIPNTLIALETGVVTIDTIFRWNGEKRYVKAWEADMNIAQAFRVSNVSVYQEIAKWIGVERMQKYIRLFNYGNMDINADNISLFWLEGKSEITPFQQIYFLQKLYDLVLPVSEKAMLSTKQFMLLEETDTYKLSAKTGRAMREGRDIGWFVGYVETKGNVYFFATNINPPADKAEDTFNQVRINLTKDILAQLGIL